MSVNYELGEMARVYTSTIVGSILIGIWISYLAFNWSTLSFDAKKLGAFAILSLLLVILVREKMH